MKHLVVYVHGKGGNADEAEHYRPLFPRDEVVGFDYRARTPWEAREEFPHFFDPLRAERGPLTLIANSIGAFFPCPRFPHDRPVARCSFLPLSTWRN